MNTPEHYQHMNHTAISGLKGSAPMVKEGFSILPRERLMRDIEKRIMAVEKIMHRLDNDPTDEKVMMT